MPDGFREEIEVNIVKIIRDCSGFCEDCGLSYKDLPMDVVLSNEQWTEITGYTEGEGILCVACILARGSKTKKYVVAKLRFE